MGQAHEDAQTTIIQVGQTAIIKYAQVVFEVCNETVSKLTELDFDRTYYGILDYGYDGTTGNVWATEPKESTVGQDLIFHASHGSSVLATLFIHMRFQPRAEAFSSPK